MNENSFIEKFEKKTDLELERILENKDKYNDEAIAASIYILKKRNVKSDVLESVENEFKIEQENKAITQAAIVEEKNHITDNSNIPELHSKKIIMAFSILFSTIFGVALLMYNMKKTENKTGRNQVLFFGIFYTIFSVLIVNSSATLANIGLLFNIAGGWILTEYFWNKFIGKELEYTKRSWVKPAIISVLITIPMILAVIYSLPNDLQ